jgi:AbiV family abortive infection protein
MEPKIGLLHAYNACLDNARDLVSEAELLLKHKHHSRAYALAFTALEEVSKSKIVADRFTDLITDDEFKSLFKKHSAKVQRVDWVIDTINKYQREHGFEYRGTRPTLAVRNAAMYVDIDYSGKCFIPKDSVTEENARDLINLVEVGLDEIWEQTEIKGEQIGTKGFMK